MSFLKVPGFDTDLEIHRMGDRCYVSVNVRQTDLAKAEEWARASGFSDNGDGEFVDEECNYGGTTLLEDLARDGVLFYGYHGNGGDYCGSAFYAVDGQLHERDCYEGNVHAPVLDVDENIVSAQLAMSRFMTFFARYQAVKEKVRRTW